MSESSHNDRHIPNAMPDYAAFMSDLQKQGHGAAQGQLTFLTSAHFSRLRQKTKAWILSNVELLLKHFPPSNGSSPISVPGKFREDSSIYVGCGGNAYVHWKLACFFEAEGEKEKAAFHLKGAATAVEVTLNMVSKKSGPEEISFYMGSAGVHALAAVIFSKAGDHSKTEKYLHKLLSFLPDCLSTAAADEVLYGRAGYLLCLLMAQKHISKELCDGARVPDAIKQTFDAIIDSGKKNGGNTGVLTYDFDGVDYFGAAHGTTGILYVLLQFPSWCQDPAHLPWITATINTVVSMQYPSGNFPCTFQDHKDETADRLVHWCHGAPGVTDTLYHAHKLLSNDDSILRSLDRALSTVWERGILKKGVGLCHGVSGSGYTFLAMYRYTGVEEHLYRAYKMAEAMQSEEVKKGFAAFHDPQRFVSGVPDFPYSLMEGLGGAVCFGCDLLHPETAAFPGYEDI